MVFNLNKVTLMGRATANVETKKIEWSNLSVVNFTVATNSQYKNAKGELITEPEYHKCTAYGNNADTLGKYLTKGKKIYIEGKLRTRRRNDTNGNPRQATEIIVQTFIFLDPKADDRIEDPDSEPIKQEEFAPVQDDTAYIHADNHPAF